MFSDKTDERVEKRKTDRGRERECVWKGGRESERAKEISQAGVKYAAKCSKENDLTVLNLTSAAELARPIARLPCACLDWTVWTRTDEGTSKAKQCDS